MSASDITHQGERCLIVQLARFGDLMQTAPLVAGLRASGCDEVHLLVQEDLAALARLIEGVERVWTLRRSEWAQVLRSGRASLIDWMNLIRDETTAIRAVGFSRVINVTHTRESAYITTLLEGKSSEGLIGERTGARSSDKWEDYFQSIKRQRSANQINLVDIHLRMAGIQGSVTNGCGVRVDPESQDKYAEELDFHSKDKRLIVGLQLGTNSPLRTWGVEKWIDVAAHINRKTEAVFALIGSPAEAPLAEMFIDGFQGAARSFAGRTSLETLPSLTGLCDLVLGGDSGAMHLTAVVGVPTISIFLAMARPQDTAPYGSGRLVFCSRRECYPCAERSGCAQPRCHDDIPPEAVADAALAVAGQRRGWSYAPGGYRLLKTSFNADGFQILTELFPNLDALSERKTSHWWSEPVSVLRAGESA